MFYYLSRADIVCSIRQHARRSASDNDLEVINIKIRAERKRNYALSTNRYKNYKKRP